MFYIDALRRLFWPAAAGYQIPGGVREKCKYIFILFSSKEKILSKFKYRYDAPEARENA